MQTFARIFRAAFLCATLGVLLWPDVTAPRAGTIRHPDGSVGPVYGMHANFVPGPVWTVNAQTASFNDGGGLVSSRGQIQWVDSAGNASAPYRTNEVQPVLNPAVAWLPGSRSVLYSLNGQWQSVALSNDPGGDVTSIRLSTATEGELLVRNADGSVASVKVSLPDGNITTVSPLPGITGSAYEHEQWILFGREDQLIVRASDGNERSVPVSAKDLLIEQMGNDWLHLSSGAAGRSWALHITATQLDLSELPQSAHTAAARRTR